MVHMRLPLVRFQPVAAAFGAVMLTILAIPAPAAAETPAEMDALFAELAETRGEAWMRAEADIARIWSQSGSPALDFLLMRGEAALDAGEPQLAIGHLTALVENAPEFPAGWASRAAAFHLAGQSGPAAADLATALRLEPRHWLALTLLGVMLEESGDDARALAAYRQSLAINPHQQDASDGVARLATARTGQDV